MVFTLNETFILRFGASNVFVDSSYTFLDLVYLQFPQPSNVPAPMKFSL